MNKVIKILYKTYSQIIKPIRTSSSLCNLLFGIKPKEKNYGEFWDWTTLALRRQIRKYFRQNMTVLDMGTGAYGILSYYIETKLNGEKIDACDITKEIIDNAAKQIDTTKINFITSNLFEKIGKKKYNIIFFNAPYIKTKVGQDLGIFKDNLTEKRFSGGEKGISVIEKFILELPNHLYPEGYCLLGVNHFYVNYNEIVKIIETTPDLYLKNYYKNFVTCSGVFVIGRR